MFRLLQRSETGMIGWMAYTVIPVRVAITVGGPLGMTHSDAIHMEGGRGTGGGRREPQIVNIDHYPYISIRRHSRSSGKDAGLFARISETERKEPEIFDFFETDTKSSGISETERKDPEIFDFFETDTKSSEINETVSRALDWIRTNSLSVRRG